MLIDIDDFNVELKVRGSSLKIIARKCPNLYSGESIINAGISKNLEFFINDKNTTKDIKTIPGSDSIIFEAEHIFGKKIEVELKMQEEKVSFDDLVKRIKFLESYVNPKEKVYLIYKDGKFSIDCEKYKKHPYYVNDTNINLLKYEFEYRQKHYPPPQIDLTYWKHLSIGVMGYKTFKKTIEYDTILKILDFEDSEYQKTGRQNYNCMKKLNNTFPEGVRINYYDLELRPYKTFICEKDGKMDTADIIDKNIIELSKKKKNFEYIGYILDETPIILYY